MPEDSITLLWQQVWLCVKRLKSNELIIDLSRCLHRKSNTGMTTGHNLHLGLFFRVNSQAKELGAWRKEIQSEYFCVFEGWPNGTILTSFMLVWSQIVQVGCSGFSITNSFKKIP